MNLFYKIKKEIQESSDKSQSWFFWIGIIFAISTIVFLRNIAIITQSDLLFYHNITQTMQIELWRTICFIISLILVSISVIIAIFAYLNTRNANILFNTIGRVIIGIAIIVVVDLFYTSHYEQISGMFL